MCTETNGVKLNNPAERLAELQTWGPKNDYVKGLDRDLRIMVQTWMDGGILEGSEQSARFTIEESLVHFLAAAYMALPIPAPTAVDNLLDTCTVAPVGPCRLEVDRLRGGEVISEDCGVPADVDLPMRNAATGEPVSSPMCRAHASCMISGVETEITS